MTQKLNEFDPAGFTLNKPFKWMNEADLTTEQKLFITDAQEQGLEVHEYSGRGMHGRYCPAVTVDDPHNEFTTHAPITQDNLGKGYVLYCP